MGCFACGSPHTQVFYEIGDVPVHSCVLLDSREEALSFPRGEIRLAFCPACGFIQNEAFDPGLLDYSRDYEETQGFSPTFTAFARDLAARLVDRYDLHGGEVLEIGCGKGEFLQLLCEVGDNKGLGIDPSCRPERITGPAADRVEVILDHYSESYTHLTGDLICCRHTLEHIQPVAAFVGLVRRSAEHRPGCAVFFEVPDTLRVLRERAFWDIYYEHCSYFTPGSLTRLFRRCGYDVEEVGLDYDDQYLLLHARPDGSSAPLPEEERVGALADEVARFGAAYRGELDRRRAELAELADGGHRVVLWGSGSKAVSLLTSLGVGREVAGVVDINPHRQGMFLPATGHRIIAPEALPAYEPDLVLAMNPIYLDEIRADLERLGVGATLRAVGP